MAKCPNLLLFAGLAGLLSAPAHAQLAPVYSGFSSAPRQGSDEHFWFALRELGNCFAKRKPEDSRALLAMEPSSQAEAEAVGAMVGRYTICLSHASRMQASTNLIRGAIAEGLYKREILAAPARAEVARPAALDLDSNQTLVPYRLLANFSRCFASRHPQEVHRIITDTPLGSEEGNSAIAALDPLVSECLPPNVKIQFEPSDIRLSLAEALYERPRAAGAPAEGSR